MADEDKPVTPGEVMQLIAEQDGGPQAAGLLVSLMDWNTRSTLDVMDAVSEGYKRDAEVWKRRALEAEDELDRVRTRVWRMLFNEPLFEEDRP